MGAWNAGITAVNINPETVGTTTFYSSSKLLVSWIAPGATSIDHYEIRTVENIGGSTENYFIPSTQTSDTITGLKSDTLKSAHKSVDLRLNYLLITIFSVIC